MGSGTRHSTVLATAIRIGPYSPASTSDDPIQAYMTPIPSRIAGYGASRVPAKYPNQKKDGELKVNPNGKNPGDVWDIPKVTSGTDRASPERTDHPAQYPEAVIERIVEASSDPGDVVLDPFLGSGTTMKVARDLGRSCIGFERDEEYVDDIVRGRVFDDYEPPADDDAQMSLDELT